MAWMSDEQYELMQDTKDKKSTARSAFHTRTHCGKSGCNFSYEKLGKKELAAMNGEVKTLRMNDPMSWEDFKALPEDFMTIYIKHIREKWGAPDKYIADAFGVDKNTFGRYMKTLGLSKGDSGHGDGAKTWNKDGFLAWWHGADPDAVKASETPIEEESTEFDIVPMNWEQFKKLSKEQKCMYVKALRERFNVTNKALAEMFGINSPSLCQAFMKLGLAEGKGSAAKRINWDAAGFQAWRDGVDIPHIHGSTIPSVEPEETVAEIEPIKIESIHLEEAVGKEKADKIEKLCEEVMQTINDELCGSTGETKVLVPVQGSMIFEGSIDDILRSVSTLLNGKNVHLKVEWDLLED